MSHEYENEIKCPYCDYEFTDSWEYNDDNEAECPHCYETFTLSVNHTTDYSSYKINCEYRDPKQEHEYEEPTYSDIDQETCDRWNKENFCNSSNHKPYRVWTRVCNKCDSVHYKNVEPDGLCPWQEVAC